MRWSLGRAIISRAGHPSGEEDGSHEAAGGGGIVLGRTYLVQYTDGRGQAQTERGNLVTLDQDGCVVLEISAKHLLVPKARADALVEVE
jgi:hypothetical protein